MGRGRLSTTRAKFHTVLDVASKFEPRTAPIALQRTGWWYFLGITVTGGEVKLLRAYSDTLSMIQDLPFDDLPLTEAPPEVVTADLLEDIPLLWPVQLEQS